MVETKPMWENIAAGGALWGESSGRFAAEGQAAR